MNGIKSLFAKVMLALGFGFMSTLALAQEASDAGITAINGLAAKGTAYIAAAFAVAVLVAGGFWGIRMMKKAFSKAG